MLGTFNKIKLRQLVEFHGNPSNRCWHMAIFSPFFSKWRPQPSWILKFRHFNDGYGQEDKHAST